MLDHLKNGRPSPALIIAEIAQAHDGSLGMAHAFIDAVARTGADAVKFQTHIAEAESSPDEPWRVRFGWQDACRFDYWKRMQFTEGQWLGLRRHAEEKGLAFLSSPFSLEAVELLERVGVKAWKIASGEVSHTALLDRILASRLPVLISSGMSSLEELDAVVVKARGESVQVTVLQCTSAYPCPPEKVGLNMIPILRRRYGCGVGLSDHSGTIYPSLAAATLGVEAIEIHVTLSREMFGPDVSSSVTTDELRSLVDGVRFIEAMRSNPVEKDAMAAEMRPMRDLFTRSVAVRRDLPAGARLDVTDLAALKPGTGIPASQMGMLCGRVLRNPVPAGKLLAESDLVRIEPS